MVISAGLKIKSFVLFVVVPSSPHARERPRALLTFKKETPEWIIQYAHDWPHESVSYILEGTSCLPRRFASLV